MNRDETKAVIDTYLLGENRNREHVFSRVAVWQPDIAAAGPIVRAITLVGARAADESLIALRLILAGREAEDGLVAALRAHARQAAAGDAAARAKYFGLLEAEQ